MRFIQMLERRKGRKLLDVELTFEIDEAQPAAAATIESKIGDAERAAFKGREFDRVRDLQDAVLAAVCHGLIEPGAVFEILAGGPASAATRRSSARRSRQDRGVDARLWPDRRRSPVPATVATDSR